MLYITLQRLTLNHAKLLVAQCDAKSEFHLSVNEPGYEIFGPYEIVVKRIKLKELRSNVQ